MARFLSIQIKLGRIILDDVPEKYRTEVEAILNGE